MFSSSVLDVAVGLIFVFFVVSLAASAILEAVAGIITWRSRTLLKGIKDLMNDQAFTGLAKQLYGHALINPRGDGKVTDDPSRITTWLRKDNIPAYIDPKQFADALIDILSNGTSTGAATAGTSTVTGAAAGVATGAAAGHPGTMVSGNSGSIADAIDYVVPATANPQINALLKGVARRADNNLEKMRSGIADWFDNAMDRVSGVYKRWTQLWHFLIALILAGVMNVSALHVASHLSRSPEVAKIIENNKEIKGTEDARKAIGQLDKLALPIGWSNYHQTPEAKPNDPLRHWLGLTSETAPVCSDLLEMILGWLITAIAAVFGAPFWFDLLQKVIRLKGSGPSPKEKEQKTAAAE
jgi:hypothetical protein